MRDGILASLQEKGDLPPLPKILLELQKLINNPDCDVDDILRLIKVDSVLTGKFITLSNSVFFGGGREKTDKIEVAVVRLGVKMAVDLCYCAQTPKAFKQTKAFDQAQFWKHSLAVAHLSRMLAGKLISDSSIVDASFLSGLMHDIGILVFDYVTPGEYEKFLIAKDIGSSDLSVETLERAVFGIDHQELGMMFLQKWWKLPPKVSEAIADHHNEDIDDEEKVSLGQIVSAANKLANEHKISHPIMTKHEEKLDESFIIKAGIEQGELEEFIDQTKIGLMVFDDIFDN